MDICRSSLELLHQVHERVRKKNEGLKAKWHSRRSRSLNQRRRFLEPLKSRNARRRRGVKRGSGDRIEGRGLGGWELARLNWSKLFKRGLLLKKSIIALPPEKRHPPPPPLVPAAKNQTRISQFFHSVATSVFSWASTPNTVERTTKRRATKLLED